jgi:hypothetical protein
MPLRLNAAAAVLNHDGKTYSFTRRKPIPDDTPDAVLDQLRANGSLQGTVPTALGLDAAAPENQTPSAISSIGGTNPVGPEIDVRSATDAQLAEFIDSNNLNVPETVALADNDPALAGKVLEAEVTASGNDPRKGVVDALTKIRDGS